MSVIIELKDGSELVVTEKMPSFDTWIYLTKKDVEEFIINREPVPLDLPTGKMITRVGVFDLGAEPMEGKTVNFVLIDPATVLVVKNHIELPFDKIAFLKRLYGLGWKRFEDFY